MQLNSIRREQKQVLNKELGQMSINNVKRSGPRTWQLHLPDVKPEYSISNLMPLPQTFKYWNWFQDQKSFVCGCTYATFKYGWIYFSCSQLYWAWKMHLSYRANGFGFKLKYLRNFTFWSWVQQKSYILSVWRWSMYRQYKSTFNLL